jgi:hypothetical protein
VPITYLDPEHHALRYVPWSKLRKDEDDNVLGVLGDAFKLRESDEYLSATWVEFFVGSHDECVVSAVQAVRGSRVDVKPRSGFAVGKVAHIRDTCLADEKKIRIRFIHAPEDDNEAHAALRNWPRDNDDLLALLAEDSWSRVVLNKDIPVA